MARRKTKSKVKAKVRPVIDEATVQKVERSTMYWKNQTYFKKFGVVYGMVTDEQREEWDKSTPADCYIDSRIQDYDPEAKAQADAKKRMRKRAGLKD